MSDTLKESTVNPVTVRSINLKAGVITTVTASFLFCSISSSILFLKYFAIKGGSSADRTAAGHPPGFGIPLA